MSEQKQGGKIVHDEDLKAMNAISKAMAKLTDDKDRQSVIEWFERKYMSVAQ